MGGASRRIYPKANTTAQWWEGAFSRSTFTRIEKILLHTTETTGWPGYKSGAAAPTLTYHPRLRAWRQHNYLDRSARALVDPDWTPVRENRDNVIQIEIITYSDEKLAATVGGLPVSKLTDDMLKDLGDFIGWVNQQWGGPPLVSAKFPYPSSRNSALRMSSSTYDAFRGVLGHLHASGNEHWDPGALNVPRIMQHAAAYVGGTTPTTAPAPEEDFMASIEDLMNYPMAPNPLDGKTPSDFQNSVEIAKQYAFKGWDVAIELRGQLEKVTAALTTLASPDVDEAALAAALAGPLADAIASKLPESALTSADVEQAIRSVLGSVDNA